MATLPSSASQGGEGHPRRPFVLRRALVAERRVPTLLVVEHLNVVEQLLLGRRIALEALAELALQRGVPALHRRVVVAVTSSAHAARDTVVGEDVLVVVARVGLPGSEWCSRPAPGHRRRIAASRA